MTIKEIAEAYIMLARKASTWDNKDVILKLGSKSIENYLIATTDKCGHCGEMEAKRAIKEARCLCK